MDKSDQLESILADWRGRCDRGESLAPEEIVRGHPELAVELRDCFAAIELVDSRFSAFGAVPNRIGEFRIVREIGRGGMGIVYEAEQPSMRRHVALKILPPSILASPKAVQRFQREARAAGSLKHTNIVGVHQLGKENGVWFMAMELVEGRPLSEVFDDLRAARPSRAAVEARRTGSEALTGSTCGSRAYYLRVAEMFAAVAEGLQVAHEHGIVHRDIKPSNLLLDVEGQLKIVDFGLARLDDAASMTITGDVVGTPSYMSPEQILGVRTLDHRTDIYSLGAALYEALALRTPFAAPGLTALIHQITRADPPRLRRRDRTIPRDLETIVLKALVKDPAQRYESAGAMARELHRFAAGETIKTRPIGPIGRAWRLVKRNKVRSSLAAALLLAILLGAAAWGVAGREAEQRQRLEYEAMCGRAELAATAEWNSHESMLPEVNQAAHAFDLYSQAIAHAPDRWPAYLGRALVRADRPLKNRLRDIDAARERGLRQRTVHMARAFLFSEGVRPLSPVDAEREAALAAQYQEKDPIDAYLKGRVLLARGLHRKAEAIFTQALDGQRDQGPLRYLSLMRRGIAREHLEDWHGALEDWLAVHQLVGDRSLETRMRIASLWWRLGQTKLASTRFDALLAEASKLGGEHAWYAMFIACHVSGEYAWMDRVTKTALTLHPDSALLLHCRFDVLFEQENQKEALATVERATSTQLADWLTHNRKGRALAYFGRHEEALKAHEAALRLSPDNPALHVNRAVALHNLERTDQAMEAVEAALAADPDFAPALAEKAAILVERKKPKEALKTAARAVALAPKLAWARARHASALRLDGQVEEALVEAERAIELDPDNADAHWIHAKILRDRGKYAQALTAFNHSIALNPRSIAALQGRALLLSSQLVRPGEAIDAWEALLAVGDLRHSPKAKVWIGNLHHGRGEWQAAIEAYEAVLRDSGDHRIDDGLVCSCMAQCLERLGQIPRAMASLRKALESSPDNPAVLVNVAGTLCNLGHFRESLKHLRRAEKLDPRSTVAHYTMALALTGIGEHDSALTALNAYLAIASNDPSGYFERARLLFYDLKRPKDALQDAKRVVKLEPEGARGHGLLGDIYLMGLADAPKALGAYEAALAVDPKNYGMRVNRALLLANLGKPAEAARLFKELLAEREHGLVLSMYARFLAITEHQAFRAPERAEELALRSIELMPDHPDLHNTLAVALCAAGRWKDAVLRLEVAMRKRGGGNGADWIYLALAHAHLGSTDSARKFYERGKQWIAANAAKDPEYQRTQAEIVRLLSR